MTARRSRRRTRFWQSLQCCRRVFVEPMYLGKTHARTVYILRHAVTGSDGFLELQYSFAEAVDARGAGG